MSWPLYLRPLRGSGLLIVAENAVVKRVVCVHFLSEDLFGKKSDLTSELPVTTLEF